MTVLIPGKRYRAVYEGVAGDDGRLLVGGITALYPGHALEAAKSIELLPDPLPTTPGSVVSVNGEFFMCHDTDEQYTWVSGAGDCFREFDLEGATVHFDAGAAS